MTEFDRAAIAAEIAEVIGTPPPRPDGYIGIGEYATQHHISHSTASRCLHGGVARGKLERLEVLENGHRMCVFRVKHEQNTQG